MPLKTKGKGEPVKATRTFRKSPSRNEKSKSPSRGTLSPSARPSTKKSPARTSPSRKASPVPKPSPAKSPTRNKSPARKSPSRKSPAGPKNPIGRPKNDATRSPGRVVDVDSDSDVDSKKEKPKTTVTGRARRGNAELGSPKVLLHDIGQSESIARPEKDITGYVGLVRRSLRKSLSREVDHIDHLKPTLATKKLTEFSDEDDVPTSSKGKKSEPKVFEERYEFGGWILATLWIFIVPLFIVGLGIACDKLQCSYSKLPNLPKYKNWSLLIDVQSFLTISSFILLLAILEILPFGGAKVSGLPNKQGKLSYVTNSLFASVVTCILVSVLEYLGVSVTSLIVTKYLQLVVSSVIIGTVLAIYLYVRSYYVPVSALNPYAITRSRFYNFWVGRELNPRPLGILDTKMLILKVFATGLLLVNASFVAHNIRFTKPAEVSLEGSVETLRSLNYNPTLAVLATLQIIYACDLLIYESTLLTTFEVQYEAVGYLTCVLGLTAPFLPGYITKYVFERNIQLPIWHLTVAGVVFLVGYILYRASNLQKHNFRQNPYSPALQYLESIPTSQGKKLLVSGFWGYLRHPNYLGDILIWLAIGSFAWNVPPALVSYGDVLYLVYRSYRDGKRCKQRYGTAWDRYCQRVKYVLLPKIY